MPAGSCSNFISSSEFFFCAKYLLTDRCLSHPEDRDSSNGACCNGRVCLSGVGRDTKAAALRQCLAHTSPARDTVPGYPAAAANAIACGLRARGGQWSPALPTWCDAALLSVACLPRIGTRAASFSFCCAANANRICKQDAVPPTARTARRRSCWRSWLQPRTSWLQPRTR